MKKITNLNFLDEKKVIKDDRNNYYIIDKKYIDQKNQECNLIVTQIFNNNIRVHNLKTTIASDVNYEYILRENNNKYKCELFETDISKQEINEYLFDYINKILNSND